MTNALRCRAIEVTYLHRRVEYGINLPPNGPLVDVGGPGKSTYFPAQLCTIEPGEPHLGKLSAKETSDMLLLANRRPGVNAMHITQQGIPKLGFAGNPTLEAFGVSINPNMTIIPARELVPPRVTYGQGSARVSNGAFLSISARWLCG